MQVASLGWITLRCLLALSKKATSFGKKKFALRELCRHFPNMSFIHLSPNDASFLLCMPIFVHLQRTDVSFISLGLPGCLLGRIFGVTVAAFRSLRPLAVPRPQGRLGCHPADVTPSRSLLRCTAGLM